MSEKQDLHSRSQAFVQYLETWLKSLPFLPLSEISGDPQKTAILSMDMTNGFCKSGALASPRVNALIEPIRSLFENAWAQGVRHILLLQDTHDPDALEFSAFPPHCVRGTDEAETVDEFKALPFFEKMVIIEKNSISSHLGTRLDDWVASHPEVENYIVVGDCTDICVYQAALQLRMQANVSGAARRVIVPGNCVATYDLPVALAAKLGAVPHDGDLLHHVFLYHMALNAVEVVAGIEA